MGDKLIFLTAGQMCRQIRLLHIFVMIFTGNVYGGTELLLPL